MERMTKKKAIKILEMFLHNQCDLGRTKCAYDAEEVWDAVKMAADALEKSEDSEYMIAEISSEDVKREACTAVSNPEIASLTVAYHRPEINIRQKPYVSDNAIMVPVKEYVPEGIATEYKELISREMFVEAYDKWIGTKGVKE